MAYLIEPGRATYALDDLAAEYGIELQPEPAAEEDTAALVRHASASLRLAGPMRQRITERGLDPLYREIELPLTEVLAAMEDAGVKIDTYRMGEITARLADRIEELETTAHELAGEEFMLGSTQQVARILFEVLGLTAGRKGKTGYSTDSRVLRSIRGEHEIVAVIEEWREYSKLLNTYLGPLPELISPEDGRLHTTFNQAVASTGRLSTTSPNLQAIPIRTELGREIRSAFVADSGHRLVSADYSQVELRILAHVSGEPKLREAFAQGEDIHAATAAEVLGKDRAELTKDERNVAKMVNFGIIYGISAFGLSENLEIPRERLRPTSTRISPAFLSSRTSSSGRSSTARRRAMRRAFSAAPPGAGAEGLQPPDALARGAARGQLRHAGDGGRHHQEGDGGHPCAVARGRAFLAARAAGARRAARRGAGRRGLGDQGHPPGGDVRRAPA
jgi:DNA polymerase-1